MTLIRTLTALALGMSAFGALAQTVVGVSWSNFQEERWKTDEAAIKAQLEKLGAKYISADAGGSPEKQLGRHRRPDGQGRQGADRAGDGQGRDPAGGEQGAQAEDPGRRLRPADRGARRVLHHVRQHGGRPHAGARRVQGRSPRATTCSSRARRPIRTPTSCAPAQQEVVDAAVKKGDIKIVGDEYTDGWKPEVAQKNMEQILTKTGGKVDAVVASNDGTAGGVVAALTAKGIRGIPVSGQDARHRGAEPRRARHADRVGVEGFARPRPRSGRARPSRSAAGKPVDKAIDLERRREEGRAAVALPDAGADHARQPRRRRQGRLDQEGRAVQGRERPTRRLRPASRRAAHAEGRCGPRRRRRGACRGRR